MSIEELEDQVEKLLDERDKLEEICDTLPQCEKDDGCETCKIYKEIEETDAKIEELEEKIEDLLGDDDIED